MLEHLAQALTVLACGAVGGFASWVLSRLARHGEELAGHGQRLSALERMADRVTDEIVARVREGPGP